MDWRQLKAEIKEKWRRLTHPDPGGIEDRLEALEGKLQPRYATVRVVARKGVNDRRTTLW